MNYLKKFLNFGFLDKVDRYLLLNYTFIWNIKLHYIIFYSLLISFFLIFMDLSPSQINKLLAYIIWMIILLYVFWLYLQKNYITIREYGQIKLNGSKEYFLYLFSTIMFFLPIFIMVILFFHSLENYNNAIKLKKYEFVNYQYCIGKDDNLSCISEDNAKPLNDVVVYLNSIDRLNVANIDSAKEKVASILLVLGIVILIIFIISFQIIFFRYGGTRNYIYMLLFSFIYIMIHYTVFQQQYDWTWYLIGLLILFFIFTRYRLIILFNILLFFLIWSFNYFQDFNLFQKLDRDENFFFSLFLITIIQGFIFGLISKYLIYIISKPKK